MARTGVGEGVMFQSEPAEDVFAMSSRRPAESPLDFLGVAAAHPSRRQDDQLALVR